LTEFERRLLKAASNPPEIHLNKYHRAGMTGRLRHGFREWRRTKTSILATTIAVLLIFFNEVLAK
jgi:hypothetical protein